jgi:hypothetical protein
MLANIAAFMIVILYIIETKQKITVLINQKMENIVNKQLSIEDINKHYNELIREYNKVKKYAETE